MIRDYDSTLARMAGDIAAGLAAAWNPGVLREDLDGLNEIAEVSVSMALAIVDEVKRRTAVRE